MHFHPDHARSLFPSLQNGAAFLDNPGGTQVPQPVIDAVVHYYREQNANLGGAFRTSRESDTVMATARQAVADLLNGRPDEIVFGQNMTTLTFHLARSIAHGIAEGDEIIVTRLDHDANISPWTSMARDTGATVRWLDFDPDDCTLRLEQLDDLLSERTKLVAVGYASNAVGTINPVKEICAKARKVDALSFVDAVQHAPHALISVEEVGCDFLACSAYKFFGPHVGALWGRSNVLEQLDAYKVRPSKATAPDKWETGTLNHEGIAGTTAAIDYLASLAPDRGQSEPQTRRAQLAASFEAIEHYEQQLCGHLLDVLEAVPEVQIYGLTDRSQLHQRVPTVSITMAGMTPREIATALGKQDIYVWDGDYYAVDVINGLGLRESGGMVRIGLAHYNTRAEVDQLGEALMELRPQP